MNIAQKLLVCHWFMFSMACTNSSTTEPTPTTTEPSKTILPKPAPNLSKHRVVPSTAITWSALNPARGDKSPQAGDLWGNRTQEGATGFIVKFVDGFASPPHIHNVSYRAIVLEGLIHNNGPKSKIEWMPRGSFWTQPAGEAHITAANGASSAYVEIDAGPYLVHPIQDAFDNKEETINLNINDIVWLDVPTSTSTPKSVSKVKRTTLWEQKHRTGQLIKLPVGFKGAIKSKGEEFHAVVIAGVFSYNMPDTNESISLDAGSYFTSTEPFYHSITTTTETILYIRSNDTIAVESTNS